MAQRQVTLTLESVVTSVTVDPVSRQVYVEGVLRRPGQTEVIRSFSATFTAAQLSAQQQAAAVLLADSAQTWLDGILSGL